MSSILHYLNPIAHLGEKKYSILFPFVITGLSAVALEVYAYKIAHDPDAAGLLAITLFIAEIIYFAFRSGIRGGMTTTIVTIGYYFYIVFQRKHTGAQLATEIQTILFLAVIYVALAWIIGWLKQTIDKLIEREADEKRRLQTIVQQLPVGVVVTDKSGKVVLANRQIETILGLKIPTNFIIGKSMLMDVKYMDASVSASQTPLAQVITSGKSVVGKEFLIQRKDGKEVHLQVNAAPIHNRNGQIIAAASIISDISQQKEMEKRKDDFVNMASHELKTPLTSMKLYLDSLTRRFKGTTDEKTAVAIKQINEQTERLQKLVNDLLDVSRLQTGKLSFTKEDFRLDKLVEESIELLQGSTNQQSIKIVKKSPIVVSADRFRIYQVITNLITNAIKYSDEQNNINVKVFRSGDKAVVSVQDFGIGIARNQQKKIFERLYQVTDDKEKTFPGFGMGLYIAKEIIKRHKGNIWVESEKGKGSTFLFSLPLQKKAEKTKK